MILVVEDNQDYQGLLRASGFTGLLASNAVDALALLETEAISIVYCDFHGIQKDGRDAHWIAEYCAGNDIDFKIATSDFTMVQVFREQYGVGSIDKLDMLRSLSGRRVI